MKEETKKEIERCKEEKEEILNSLKRERADFLNYKREEEGRITSSINYFLEKITLDILPVLDSFEIAKKAIPDNLKEDEHVIGFLKISDQLNNFLRTISVEEIDCLGKDFDPYLHEAVEMVDGKDQGKIKEEVQKGYKLKDKVIRPSKVKIVKG